MRTRIALLFALFFLSLSALAQSSWGLTNTSNNTLTFDIYDSATGNWRRSSIYPNQSKSYHLAGESGKFRIQTNNRGFVEYKVLVGKRYNVGWNRQKGMWDLKFAPGYGPSHAGSNSGQYDRANVSAPHRPYQQRDSLPSWDLYNRTNNTLSFETYDPARGTWIRQTAYPHQSKTYTFYSGSEVGKIRIATKGRGFVQYRIRAYEKYSLMWDDDKGMWDVRIRR